MRAAIDLRADRPVASTPERPTAPPEIDSAQGRKLEPGKFVFGQTAGRVALRLPDDMDGWPAGKPVLAARVEGRSSMARVGVIVRFAAPAIQAGFGGTITPEMMCHSGTPFALHPGMAICRLVLEPLPGVPVGRASQFSTKTGRPASAAGEVRALTPDRAARRGRRRGPRGA